MENLSSTKPSLFDWLSGRPLSLRTKLIGSILLIVFIALAGMGYYVYFRAQEANTYLTTQLEKSVRQKAEDQLVTASREQATLLNSFFVSIHEDITKLSASAENLLSQETLLGNGTYWDASHSLFRKVNQSWDNADSEEASVFIPADVQLTEALISELNTLKQTEIFVPPLLASRPDIVAVYFGGVSKETIYYPNIDLAALVPPDFDVTGRPWFVAAAPQRNPMSRVVWSVPYLDAALHGLVITGSIPVFDSVGSFRGVAAMDIQLTRITDIVSKIRIGGTGYAFIADTENRLIAMPQAGYNDFGASADTLPLGEVIDRTKLTNVHPEFFEILTRISSGEEGLTTVTIDGVERFVVYQPIPEVGYGLAIIVPTEELQAEAIIAREQVAQVTRNALTVSAILVFAILVAASIAALGMGNALTGPLRVLTNTAEEITGGNLEAKADIRSRDELGTLAKTLNTMTSQLRGLVTGLEGRVHERTAQLERRARQLQAAAEVGRAITSLTSLDELLTKTTQLIASQFGYYHAGIFLMDERGEYAVLSAANSAGGQRMLARGHRLKVGQTGIVGHVTQTGKARIALDVGQDAVFFDNPDLPETRSEMALPLVLGDEILGALDVQSVEPQAFSHDDITTLQVLADQLAVAIKNSRLFEENRIALEATRRRYTEISREAWARFLKEEAQLGYLATAQGTMQRVAEPWEPDLAKSVEAGDLMLAGDGLTIGVPLKVRGQVIGALRLKKPEASSQWTQDETSLALAIAEQLSGALDSARLYKDAQQRAARESLVSGISARISAAPRVDTILRETAKELGQAIANTSVTFKLISLPFSPEKVEVPGNGSGELHSIEDVGLREIQRIVMESGETGYVYLPEGKLVETGPLDDTATRQALTTGETVTLNGPSQASSPMLAMPVKLRDQAIGIIQIQAKEPDRRWTENEIALVQTIAERAAAAIENASLLSESQRRAAKERTIGEISAKIGSLTDIDNIVQTAIQELSRTLPGTDVAIQFQNK